MKIICTQEEKEKLVKVLPDIFYAPCSPDCQYDCQECVDYLISKNIEWQIEDGENNG